MMLHTRKPLVESLIKVHINIVYDCEDADLFFLDVKGKVGNKFSLQQVKLQTFTGKENQFFSNYFVRNKLV